MEQTRRATAPSELRGTAGYPILTVRGAIGTTPTVDGYVADGDEVEGGPPMFSAACPEPRVPSLYSAGRACAA